MNEQFKRATLSVIAITFLALGLWAALVYVIDPLQIYRKSTLKFVYDDTVYLNAGILRHYSYDTIVVGTSTAQCYANSEIDDTFGGQSVNLTFGAARALEMSRTIEKAYARGGLKRVVLFLDVMSFANHKEQDRRPTYLYDASFWNDYRYLLNFDIFIKRNAKLLLANALGRYSALTSHDRQYCWASEATFSRKLAYRHWNYAKLHERNVYNAKIFNLGMMREIFLKTLAPAVKALPDVEFMVISQPYSILYWKRFEEMGVLEDITAFNLEVFDILGHYPNVQFFDYQTNAGLTLDLDEYKDMLHFSPAVNRIILDNLSNQRGRVRSRDAYALALNELRDTVRDYALLPELLD